MFSFGSGDIVFDRVKAKEKDWKANISVFEDELRLFRFVLKSVFISDNLSSSRFK